MGRIWSGKDKSGRIIYLTNERWSHINQEHPEVASHIHEFGDILKNPTRIASYSYDEQIFYYYRYFKATANYLLIIVKYLNGEGFILTAYFVRHIT